ncbi:MAG: hypothetical protein IJB98_02185, partial [Clostridia bacterium]|nr:hypothetical protein [Clostridia bacterium]
TESDAETDNSQVKTFVKSERLKAIEEQLREHYAQGGKLNSKQFAEACAEAGLDADEVEAAQGIYGGLETQRQEAAKQERIEKMRKAKEEKAARKNQENSENSNSSGSGNPEEEEERGNE